MTEKLYRSTVLVLLVLAGSFSLYALLIKLNGPLLDAFGFRQTQTAISVYYMLQGGPILGYETPVIWYPWAMPFEFPVYQVIVAAIARLFGHIDAAGRLVSYVFFLLCLIPVARLYELYRAPRYALAITAIFALASPLYLLYSRAFLIETTALFLSLMWLWLFARALRSPSLGGALLCAGFGTLAMLAKSTTFLSITLFGAVLLAPVVAAQCRERAWRAAFGRLVMAAAVTLPPIALGYAWVAWTDDIRSLNEFGTMLTSAQLRDWNFGFPGQRTSPELWRVIATRMPVEIFGYVSLAALTPVGAALATRRIQILVIAALATILGTLLIFPNLHFVHNYYQTSFALFALMACALGVSSLYESGSRVLSLAVLLVVTASQLVYAYGNTLPTLRSNYRSHPYYRISKLAQSVTSPDQAIVVLGADWTSEIAYYAERRAGMIASWARKPLIEAWASDPSAHLNGMKVGAVIVCGPDANPDMAAAAAKLTAGRTMTADVAPCRLYTEN